MDIELIEKTAQKVNIYGDLDSVIRKLQVFKSAGVNVYVDFNGNKLYSLVDDVDSAYTKVTGMNKKDFEEAERQWKLDYERKQAEAKAKAEARVPAFIEDGKKLVYPQKQKMWEKCVKTRVADLYHGADLKNAIDVMKVLETAGDFEEGKRLIDAEGHSGASYGMVMSIITEFSKKGPDFYEFMEPEDSNDPKTKDYLDKIREQNQKYEEELANGSSGFGA